MQTKVFIRQMPLLLQSSQWRIYDFSKEGARRHWRRGDGAWWRGLGPSLEKNHFCPQNDKFRCILMQFLTGRKHKHSLELWDTDCTVQSWNEAGRNSAIIIQKFTVRPKGAVAAVSPWICHRTLPISELADWEHLTKRQLTFRVADSAFPQLYCLKFSCK